MQKSALLAGSSSLLDKEFQQFGDRSVGQLRERLGSAAWGSSGRLVSGSGSAAGNSTGWQGHVAWQAMD